MSTYISIFGGLSRAMPTLYAIQPVPASVAQLDACPTGNQDVVGLTPCWVTNILIGHDIFSMVILSLPLIQERQLSVSGGRMCTILVNRLED